ncbi:solute carrier family 28 member 3-like [Dermacentor silvarum]|uniref:solute carrier family 28 member 3-like n=1 Tax=Dermacentor silvarum TaxID=543639 RepID=UPI0018996910|nr:solute carrier family 28 member 3-like [Dermacentor silvarum]
MPSASPVNPDKRDPNREAARRPPGWYLAYHRHVRPRLWLCPVTLYAVYLCGAVRLSWKASDDWCSEPRFQALVTLTLCSVWALLQVARLAGRLYRKRGARIEHALDQAAEQGWAAVFWCVLYALLIGCFVVDSLPDMHRIWSALGVGAIVAICYIFSCERRKIAWHVVLSGIVLQFVLGTVMIRSSVGHGVVTCLGTKLKAVINYSRVGAQFTFGHAATGVIGEATPRQPHVFAFHIMTMTVFFSFLMSLVAFYGCLRKLILSIATSLRWSTGVSPCDALCVATNIVAAQNDLPWILRGYVGDMTLSQLHTAMASGFGSLSAATFAALISYEVDVASLISACVMSAPAVLVTSKMLLPEIEHPDGAFEFLLRLKSKYYHKKSKLKKPWVKEKWKERKRLAAVAEATASGAISEHRDGSAGEDGTVLASRAARSAVDAKLT